MTHSFIAALPTALLVASGLLWLGVFLYASDLWKAITIFVGSLIMVFSVAKFDQICAENCGGLTALYYFSLLLLPSCLPTIGIIIWVRRIEGKKHLTA